MRVSPTTQIYLIFITALLVQMFIWYHPTYWVLGPDDFRASTLLARLAPPLLINILFLNLSARDLGWAWPKVSARHWKWLAATPLVILIAVSLVRLSSESTQYYQGLGGEQISLSVRALHFALFTFSTLPAWEFLHRSFLLFGLYRILTVRLKLDPKRVEPLVIGIVCSFEVIFHFQKPMNEPLGMLVASPLLSFIALRSESVLIPLLLHHIIELVFFFFITA